MLHQVSTNGLPRQRWTLDGLKRLGRLRAVLQACFACGNHVVDLPCEAGPPNRVACPSLALGSTLVSFVQLLQHLGLQRRGCDDAEAVVDDISFAGQEVTFVVVGLDVVLSGLWR